MTAATPILCEWFLLCDHPADGFVQHPVLGYVPTCERCTKNMELSFAECPYCAPDEPCALHAARVPRLAVRLLHGLGDVPGGSRCLGRSAST